MSLPPAVGCDQCGEQARGGLTRRGLLAAAAVAAGAGRASAATAPTGEEVGTSPDPLPTLVGTVAATGADRVIVDPAQQGRPATTVVLGPGAKVWRLGDASLGDYELGDDISVYGTAGSDGVVTASMVTCDLYSVQGPVRSPSASSVTLGTTPLRVGSRMQSPAPSDEVGDFFLVARSEVPALRPGAEANALVLRNLRGPGLIWKLGVR
jgi:hypothetical protein